MKKQAPPPPQPSSYARVVPATEAAKNFGRLVSRVCEERVAYVVERGGVPVAQVVPPPRVPATVADLAAVLRGLVAGDGSLGEAVREAHERFNRPEVPADPWRR